MPPPKKTSAMAKHKGIKYAINTSQRITFGAATKDFLIFIAKKYS